MKLSWSEKLFLRINALIGMSRTLDAFMIFAARWLIFVFMAMILVWLFFSEAEQMFYFIFTLGTGILASIILNWTVALFMRKPRPIVEFPKITQLIKPHQTFKSFPSDHTTIAFTLALIVVFIGVQEPLKVTFLSIAGLIAFSRVYVGVHFPRDILGGLVMAALISSISFWLATHVTIPLFVKIFA